jgi:SAM-dependent methyltransferase
MWSRAPTMVGVDVQTFEQLLSPAGQRLLAHVEQAYDGDNALTVSARCREVDRALVAACLTQADCRRRAVVKFGADAAWMYFTPDGLEQSTRQRVAAHRARRVSRHGGTIVDLGCGIGGDLIALSRVAPDVLGVEIDPLRAAVAAANLASLSLGGSVEEADARQLDLSTCDVVVADPTRRNARGRVFDPAAYSPPWSFVESLLTRTSVVKVAAGIPRGLVPNGVEAEWVSDDRGVKEAALWSGGLARVRRRATVLPSGDTLTDVDDPGLDGVGVAERLEAFVYEPDGAVIRAGLVTAAARFVSARLIDPKIAYLTGGRQVQTPLARCFRVLEELPMRTRALRAALRARGIGSLTIKKRGVEIDPAVLRRQLALSGDRAATIILTRLRDRGIAVLVEPV